MSGTMRGYTGSLKKLAGDRQFSVKYNVFEQGQMPTLSGALLSHQNGLKIFAGLELTFSGAPLQGRLPALHTSIRLRRKDLPVTNNLSYYEKSPITFVKSLIALTPGPNVVKLFCPQFTKFGTKLGCLINKAGKACQGQTLQLIMRQGKKIFKVGTWTGMTREVYMEQIPQHIRRKPERMNAQPCLSVCQEFWSLYGTKL